MKWKRRGMVFMMNDLKAYLRYYINSNKRQLILVFIILFLMMPFFTFNYFGLPRNPESEDTFYTGLIALGAAACAGGCILSYLLPICLLYTSCAMWLQKSPIFPSTEQRYSS